jgi:hypothetical protein
LNQQSLRSPESLLLYVLIAISLIASLVGFKNRFSVEAKNKRVETVVDYGDAVNLSLASHQPLDAVLTRLNHAGITSLALTEDTVDSLRTDGALIITDESSNETTFRCSASEPILAARLTDALARKTSLNFTQIGGRVRVEAPYWELASLGLGLDPSQISAAIRNGFYICPRLANFPGADAASINWMLQTVKNECGGRATTLIFSGLDVLGDRNNLRATADALESTSLNYGSVEFGKQIGDDVLSRLAAPETVRVHSIGGNEMPTMDIPTAIGRFGLAARERSIRVCYIRLFIGGAAGEPDILQTNAEFVSSICKTITDGGLVIGPAHPYSTDPLPGKAILVLMSFGVGAGGLLLLKLFTGINGKIFWALLGASIVAGAFLATRQLTPIGREILALAAAMAFPTTGILMFGLRPVEKDVKTSFAALIAAMSTFCCISAATFAGILLVVGLLADRLFMLKVYEFAGIRVAVFTPILLTALYLGLNFDALPLNATWADRKQVVVAQWNKMMSSPLLVGQIIVGVFGLAIVGVILARSGNDPGIGVSSTELGFRSFLNKVLSVRPRTKEFLFGHPLLVMGLALAYSGRRKGLPIFLLAGAIGQASLLNTFCHIHTPLMISLLRAIIGLVLGGVFGAAAYLVLKRFIKPDFQYSPIME